jgi:hypothetical protein
VDDPDFADALAAWSAEFSAREDSLEASWERAGLEERWGDSLFFGGEPGCAAHYQAAQRALAPQGTIFSSLEENERRMDAYTRLTNKLYAVGPDGRSRPGHDAQPHPRFHPIVRQNASKPERQEAVRDASKMRAMKETALGQLYRDSDHWRHHLLGNLWLEAARALASSNPADARRACEWSRNYFELYNRAWSAHLPASRWDSDGGAEMEDVQTLEDSLADGGPESPPPDWARLLLAGDWLGARAAFAGDAPAPEFKPLAVILDDACQTAGRKAPG